MENFLCSSKKLMDAIQNIERILNDIMKHENHRQHRSNFSQQSHQQTPHIDLRGVQPPAPTVHSKSTPQSYTSSSSQPPPNQDAGSKILIDTGLRHTSDIRVDQNPVEQETALDTTITTTKPKKVRIANELPALNSTKKIVPKPTGQLTVVQVSRSHSKEMSKLIKSEGQEHKELALTYNTLDFAGQKEYHPMHHCFITRRAIYLVVFNLQKMIKYITKKEQNAENPLEQIRYWLHSIHAHVFPPKEDDHMRRVCIVGTHRSPKQSKDGEEITEGKLQRINNELRTLERDERCVSHLHYTSNPERMFIAVENSMDKKGERELSGALQLQRELKEVSNNLKFLEEDHPVIWLNFEAQLVEYCNMRKSAGSSVVVPVQDVLAIASRNGIETEDDQHLALDFFHDTGKIIYLKRLPILFLPDKKDRELLLNLVILEPAWLIGVMKIIMELSRTSQGDRRLIIKLDDTGIASESLLREKWADFYTESESGPSFHQLCLILQAYCLIFPLKGFQSPAEPALPSADGQTSKSFLVPSKMPEIAKADEVDSDVPWVVFYFDFEKFLPEVIYHRLICIMLACADDYTSEDVMPKFSKSWSCFYDIEESHWKFKYQQTLHRLQVSIQTEDRQKRSSHFFKIHDHLRQICDQSHLQGLKYYGGPEARCKCKGPNSEQISRILRFAEYHGEKRICERKMSSKCKKCFKEFKLDDILDLQVLKEEIPPTNSENDSVQDSNSEPVEKDGAASTTSDNRNGAGVLSGKVTLSQLVVLKPRSGEKLRIIDSAKHKWKEITSLICSDTNKISTLEKQDSDDCLRQVLINCFLENKPQNYSQDWNGLIELLDDVGLQVLADDVKKYFLETECMLK